MVEKRFVSVCDKMESKQSNFLKKCTNDSTSLVEVWETKNSIGKGLKGPTEICESKHIAGFVIHRGISLLDDCVLCVDMVDKHHPINDGR